MQNRPKAQIRTPPAEGEHLSIVPEGSEEEDAADGVEQAVGVAADVHRQLNQPLLHHGPVATGW